MENTRRTSNSILRDAEAELALERIKDIRNNARMVKEQLGKKVHELTEMCNNSLEVLSSQETFLVDKLHEYFNMVEPTEAKTIKVYNLTNGKLVLNKATRKLEHNDVVILEWAKQFKQYTKVVEELDWSSLKANLIITDTNTIVTKNDHTTLDVRGLKVTQVPEKFEVKY